MTNKDQHDDAEFDLFLKGEGELAGKVKAVGQTVDLLGPSAELDAAILAAIERELKQEAEAAVTKSGAANDPVVPVALETQPVRLPSKPWMTRWRVPLGLAAGLMLGILLHRSFQSEDPLELVARHAEVPKSAGTVAQQSPLPPPPASMPPMASAELAEHKPASPPLAEQQTDRSSVAVPPARVPVPTAPPIATSDTAVHSPALKPAPAPKVAQATGESNSTIQRVEVTGSVIQRVPEETASPVQVITPSDLDTSPAAPAQTSPDLNAEKKNTVSGYTAAPVEIQTSAQKWLELIEDNLKREQNDEALKNWVKFRNAYPDYTVQSELTDKINNLQNRQDQK